MRFDSFQLLRFFFSGLGLFILGTVTFARFLTGSWAGLIGRATCGSAARFLFRAGGGGGAGGGGAGAGAGAGSGLFFFNGFCSCVLAFLFLPLTRGGTVMGRVCVAALGVLAMSNASALILMPPLGGGGGGGLLDDEDAATSRGAGAGPWIFVPRRSIAASRSVILASSWALR